MDRLLFTVSSALYFGFICLQLAGALKCPGPCTRTVAACKAQGGKVVGYCTNEKPCCDFSTLNETVMIKKVGTCGDIKTGLATSIFQSPDYPETSKGPLICTFEFRLNPKFEAIYIEFLDVDMDGLSFGPHSACDADMLVFQGMPWWKPPERCGNLTGYTTVIDRNNRTMQMKYLRIVAVMSSIKYKWKIRLTQVLLKPLNKVGSSHTTTPSALIPVPDDETAFPNITQTQQLLEPFGITANNQTVPDQSESLAPRKYSNDQFHENQMNMPEENMATIESEPLIQNGEDVNVSEVPWQASLRKIIPLDVLIRSNLTSAFNRESGANCTDIGRHFCGGSIISDQHILTASHCVAPLSKFQNWAKIEEIKVVLGDSDICLGDDAQPDKPSQTYAVDKIFFHFGYDHIELMEDVAVIKLKQKIQFTDYIKPIKLAPSLTKFYGKSVKVSGWGRTNLTLRPELDALPYHLKFADELTVQNKSVCDRYLKALFRVPENLLKRFPRHQTAYESVLCTNRPKNGTKDQNVGQGDSGGCLFHVDESTNEPIQVGVVSYGVPLAALNAIANFEDFYQDVSHFRTWIDLVMKL